MSGNGNQNQQRPPAPRPTVIVPSAAVAAASVPPQGQEPAGAATGEGGGEGQEKVTPEVVQAPVPSAQVEAFQAPPAEVIPKGHTKVYPMKTVQRVRIGPEWYQFITGKACTVPTVILPLLIEKQIIPPQG